MAKIEYYGELSRVTGKHGEEISAVNIKTLLNEIRKRYGKPAYMKAKTSLIAVDGYKAARGMNTILNSDSTVSFYPICGGG